MHVYTVIFLLPSIRYECDNQISFCENAQTPLIGTFHTKKWFLKEYKLCISKRLNPLLAGVGRESATFHEKKKRTSWTNSATAFTVCSRTNCCCINFRTSVYNCDVLHHKYIFMVKKILKSLPCFFWHPTLLNMWSTIACICFFYLLSILRSHHCKEHLHFSLLNTFSKWMTRLQKCVMLPLKLWGQPWKWWERRLWTLSWRTWINSNWTRYESLDWGMKSSCSSVRTS